MHFETPPQGEYPYISMVAMPRDTNALGDIFGGWLMSHADIAGAILAYRHAGGRVVTVAVKSFVFIGPVFVGDRASFYADLVRVGNTSVTVDVSIFAQSNWNEGALRRVATATMTYVHVGEDRRPLPIAREKRD